MGVAHEPWLVVLSLVVAIQGAYVGLSLAVQLGEAAGFRRRLLLAGAAISLAVAIWAMHFVAMLAARMPFPIDYLVFPTLLSFLVCVLVVGAAVFAVSAGPLGATRLAAAAVVMGGGIALMHYIGMMALHASAHMHHAPPLVVASVAIGMAASGLALWLAGGRGRRPPLLLSATALGMAIAGMHYTAMAGLTLVPFEDAPAAGAPALSPGVLAIVVAIVAFIVSAIFLLALVPDRIASAGRREDAPPPAAEPEAAPPDAAISGRVAFLPVSGAEPGAAAPEDAAPEDARARPAARHLPVERDGATQFVPVERIVAVHANAHYTFLFDGTARLFCPLAIGDVESRLDTDRFLRVHRSHIVNIDRITGMRRSGDGARIELAASERYTVPVSRSRIGWLKTRLDSRMGAIAS